MSSFEVLSLPMKDNNGVATTLGAVLLDIQTRVHLVSTAQVDPQVLSDAIAAGVKVALAQLSGTVQFK